MITDLKGDCIRILYHGIYHKEIAKSDILEVTGMSGVALIHKSDLAQIFPTLEEQTEWFNANDLLIAQRNEYPFYHFITKTANP